MTNDLKGWSSPFLRVDSPTFGRVDGSFYGRVFVRAGKSFRADILRLVSDLAARRIGVRTFVRRADRRVREAYLLVYSLGALSVDPFHTVTVRDIRKVDGEIDGEKHFLRTFARDLRGGSIILDPTVRANLYVHALRGVFELGRMEALPPGPYDWVTGDTEHCLPCLSAARNGPYQRDRFSGLGLPVLPGIPGSGDICRGLTRCGCRTRLSNGFDPNAELQSDLRRLLAEIVHEE